METTPDKELTWWPDNDGGEWTYGPNNEVIYRE